MDLLYIINSMELFQAPHSSKIFQPHRLTLDDYWIAYMDDSGFHVPMQLIFLMDTPYDAEHLEYLNKCAWSSSFGRARGKSIVPWAPDYWGTTTRVPEVSTHEAQIEYCDVPAWLDKQVRKLPQGFQGPGWQISAANLPDGKSVVSMTLMHYVADGLTAILELYRFLEQRRNNLPPAPPEFPQIDYRHQSLLERVRADIAALPGFNRSVRALFGKTALPRLAAAIEHKFSSKEYTIVHPNYTAFFDLAELTATAKSFGGTVTSLVCAIACNTGWRINPSAECVKRLSVIANRRPENGPGSNSATTCPVDIKGLPLPFTELGPLRKACKEAYNFLQTGSPAESLKPSVVVSPVGQIPTIIGDLVPGTTHIYARATPYADTILMSRPAKQLVSFYTIFENTLSLTFANGGIGDNVPLDEAMKAEFTRWGLTPISLFSSNGASGSSPQA